MATLEEILKLDSTSQVSDPKKSKAVAHLDEESRNMLHGIDCAGDRPHKKRPTIAAGVSVSFC